MRIVVDASALLAITLGEPDRETYRLALRSASEAWIAPPNVLEIGLRLYGVGQGGDVHIIRALLERWKVRESELVTGLDAVAVHSRYGRRRHPAALNLADCFAYALAKRLDAPLLYKGDDFARTDIRSALDA